MPTPIPTIRQWFLQGVNKGYHYMLVRNATFSDVDTPSYSGTDNFWAIYDIIEKMPGYKIKEIYDLRESPDGQLTQDKAWRTPPRIGVTASLPDAWAKHERLRAESLARRFHETYEKLAPSFGYETKKDSAVPWEDVPEKNRNLMIATCKSILDERDRIEKLWFEWRLSAVNITDFYREAPSETWP